MKQGMFVVALAVVLTVSAVGQAVTFTGDVAADFPGDRQFADVSTRDVGIPLNFPPSTISGWDMVAFGASYDAATDTLFLGIDSFGVFGDADGDLDPGNSRPELVMNAGVDHPNFEGTEVFNFQLDLDNDGAFDFAAGLPLIGDITGYTVETHSGLPGDFSAIFNGSPRPGNVGTIAATPSAAFPDLEVTMPNFSDLITEVRGSFDVATDLSMIRVRVFGGSLDDDGLGEDSIEAVIDITPPEDPDGDDPDCTPETWKDNLDKAPKPGEIPNPYGGSPWLCNFDASDPLYWDFCYTYVSWYGFGYFTYEDALCFDGGTGSDLCDAAGCLLREAAAAIWNAVSPCIDYPKSYHDITCDVNSALYSCDLGTIQMLEDDLRACNEACVFPLDCLCDPDDPNDPDGDPECDFFDDFSGGLSGWSNTDGNSFIQDGEFKVHGWSNPYADNCNTYADFIVSTDVKINYIAAAVVFRAQDDQNFYRVRLEYNGKLKITRRQNGSWCTLSYENIGLQSGVDYELEIRTCGNMICVGIDGTVVATICDDAFSSGKIGFRQTGCHQAKFDNFCIVAK